MPRLFIFHHFLLAAFAYCQNDLELTWGQEQSPFPNENVHQQFPDAVVGDDGLIHIVWLEQHGNQKSIMYCKSSDGDKPLLNLSKLIIQIIILLHTFSLGQEFEPTRKIFM